MRATAIGLMILGAGLALASTDVSAAPRRYARPTHARISHPRVSHSRIAHARVLRVRAYAGGRSDPAYAAPPLTIRRRSYLDPGDVVPEGSRNQYVWVPNRPHNDLPDTGGLAWLYGAGTLPGPFTAPGRPVNLLDYDLDYGAY